MKTYGKTRRTKAKEDKDELLKATDDLLNKLSNRLGELFGAIDKRDDKELKQLAKRFLETFKEFLAPFVQARELFATLNVSELVGRIEQRSKTNKVTFRND